MIRVLVVAEQLRRKAPGGIGTYVSGLLGGVDGDGGQGVAVTAYASRGRGPDPLDGFGLATRSSLLTGPMLTRLWDRGGRAPRGYDVVHASSLAFPAADRLVVTVHDLAWRVVPDAFPDRGRRWHEAALQRALARATAFVVPSEDTARHLDAASPLPVRIEVIEHGSDHMPAPDDAATRRVLADIGVVGPYLLAVGTLEPRKNLRRLVEAYTRVRDELPEPWPLVVAGPAGWGGDLVPAEGVVQTGRVDDSVLAGLYASARVVAYVPLLEGFGFPPVEAMAVGAPVVASPMPSTGGAALEVDPLDVDSIAGGLVAVATDDQVRADLVARGRDRAAALTWREAARRHIALWREVTSGR